MVHSGPPLLFYLFSAYHEQIFTHFEGVKESDQRFLDIVTFEEGPVQKAAKLMVWFHFGKILAESAFLHRYTGRMTSLNRTLWQILFYWLGLGVLVGFSLFSPDYRPSFLYLDLNGEDRILFPFLASALFLAAEVLNFLCHLHFHQMEGVMAA